MSAISSQTPSSPVPNPHRTHHHPCAVLCAVVCVVVCLFAGCAPQKSPRQLQQDTLWALFLQQQADLPMTREFAIRASINYSSSRQKHRVIMRLYGNLTYPIRMDLEAGIGRTISIWREDASSWQAYLPEENRLYLARDGKTGARSIGFPTPFDLKELAQVLQGNILSVLPPNPVSAMSQDGGQYLFFPASNRIAKILLDAQARVVEIYGKNGWTVHFDYQESSPYSQKVIITMENDTQATLRIKSVASRTFDTDLAISLEEHTEIIHLDSPFPAGRPQADDVSTKPTIHTPK